MAVATSGSRPDRPPRPDTEAGGVGRARPARAADLGGSLVTKSGGLFVLCQRSGDIDVEVNASDGLYFHDTRFLDVCRMRLEGQVLAVLLDEADGAASICELTNPDIQLLSGTSVHQDRIGVRRERRLSGEMEESVEVFNFCATPFIVTLGFDFDADFENMFAVRGGPVGQRGKLHPPQWEAGNLVFAYDGADGRRRTTTLAFDPEPTWHGEASVGFSLSLQPGSAETVSIRGQFEDAGPGSLERSPQVLGGDRAPSRVQVTSDNPLFDRILERSFSDLQMLLTRERNETFFAAGVPWYVALFGRDSVITSLETLAFQPAIAATTLRLLAKHQARRTDPWRDEEPGKILHELRVGEMANLGEVPQTPYYGTVDATPLFVILLGEYVRWTADTDLATELGSHLERALDWIEQCGDHDGDGFVDYQSQSAKGSRNQGWKDSDNGILNRDGTLAEPPIALVEVQSYVYRAYLEAAWLYRLQGQGDLAANYEGRADELQRRFHNAFWMPELEYLAVAIQCEGRRAESITSNAGQALWGGIVSAEHAQAVAGTLLSDRMFSGWGVRTLAQGEVGYNPIDYQVGSVWPHDCSLIAAGLKRYGFDREALQVFTGLFEAAARFDHYRLPEVFAGFSRARYSVPVRYPVACNPQAWAAGSLPYLLHTALGLEPDAPGRRLAVRRPVLPEWLGEVTLHGVRVGAASVDLCFERSGERTLVGLLDRRGDVELSVSY